MKVGRNGTEASQTHAVEMAAEERELGQGMSHKARLKVAKPSFSTSLGLGSKESGCFFHTLA